MDNVMDNTTTFLKKESLYNKRKWFIFDATDKILGRFASEIAKILRGKHRPNYTPHVDCGDGVIIINAKNIAVSDPRKKAQKIYRRYTGYVGGLRETVYKDMMAKKPEFIIMHAVKGMMPKKSHLSRVQLKRLRIYKDDAANEMKAQKPIVVK